MYEENVPTTWDELQECHDDGLCVQFDSSNNRGGLAHRYIAAPMHEPCGGASGARGAVYSHCIARAQNAIP